MATLIVAAVVVLVTAPRAAGPGAAPPARVLSRYELAAPGNMIDRDCGYSVPLPGRDDRGARRSLWLFCDSVWRGTRPGMVFGVTAAAGAAAPGRVPDALTELPAPGRPAGPRDGPPQGLLAPPDGLVLPGGAPCRVPGAAYSASWASGAARVPGSDAVLITYTDVCVRRDTIATQGFGVVEYRPGDRVVEGRTRLFTAPAGLPAQQNLGSPVFAGGYLYLFAAVCDSPALGGCGAGRVMLARVRADPASWRDPGAYMYRTGSGWSRDAFGAVAVVPGALPLAVHVADFGASGQGLVMVEQAGLGGRYRLWRARSPEGPWRRFGEGRVPCADGTGHDQCRALFGHPELSTREALLLSYYDPGDDHVTVRAVPWREPG
ncbi:hypothetical protein [Spirillospora albida]|uniref:hypothetical protein n=1 Tax=Spirillospora albida TaxID=58123 RepID=UPI0004C1DA09|nr:hypothetical protein [Spirillospora albida]